MNSSDEIEINNELDIQMMMQIQIRKIFKYVELVFENDNTDQCLGGDKRMQLDCYSETELQPGSYVEQMVAVGGGEGGMHMHDVEISPWYPGVVSKGGLQYS